MLLFLSFPSALAMPAEHSEGRPVRYTDVNPTCEPTLCPRQLVQTTDAQLASS
jgi:hypothetical protein